MAPQALQEGKSFASPTRAPRHKAIQWSQDMRHNRMTLPPHAAAHRKQHGSKARCGPPPTAGQTFWLVLLFHPMSDRWDGPSALL